MKLLAHLKKAIGTRIVYLVNLYYDSRICGRSLAEYIPSVYRDDKNGIGLTGSQSTYYWVLDKIFSNVEFTEQDSFLDVGCGMGRVLAFCVKEKYPCAVNGIEINEVPGKIAQEWSEKYSKVDVQIGDALQLNYNPYTVLFLGRPFLPKTFLEFLGYFESNLTHPVTFIYWVDQQSGHFLNNREGWTLKKREIIRKVHGIQLPNGPQWYSIWNYTPKNMIQKKQE